MNDHTVKRYDKELEEIGLRIVEMGGIAEKMLADSMEALATNDVELATATAARDPRLDLLQRAVEELNVTTIARRQPMASDLRELVGAVRIANDLERVGDLSKNIAKRTIKIASEPRIPRATVGLRHMAELAAAQLKDVLDAYTSRDVTRARQVWSRDAQIDALEESIFRELLTFMMEDPRNISYCTHLLFCSKNIERIGDHATNIAETVHFVLTGEPLPVQRPRGDDGNGVNSVQAVK